jgi:thioredoxin 1
MSKPIAVTDDDFDTQVLQSTTPVLVDFWAAWCGPCRMVAPIVEQIADEAEGSLVVAKMDVDKNPMTPGKFGIRSIPTLILFKNGEAVQQIVGFKPKKQLLDQIGKHVEGLVPA